MTQVVSELDALRADLDQAASAILSAAERAQGVLNAAPPAEDGLVEELEILIAAVTGACAFHDLAGQRLGKIERLLSGGASSQDADGLLNGPAAMGQGLDQAAADALFDFDR